MREKSRDQAVLQLYNLIEFRNLPQSKQNLAYLCKGALSLLEVTLCINHQNRSEYQPNSLFGCVPQKK